MGVDGIRLRLLQSRFNSLICGDERETFDLWSLCCKYTCPKQRNTIDRVREIQLIVREIQLTEGEKYS